LSLSLEKIFLNKAGQGTGRESRASRKAATLNLLEQEN